MIKQQGKNKTVLFSTHILQEVEAICDRVIIINKGEIVADDKLSNLRQRSTTNFIRVSFKESWEEDWMKNLSLAKSVTKIDAHNWQLATDNPEQLRKQILELALQHNLNIVSLQSENTSLEEIFRNLTVVSP